MLKNNIIRLPTPPNISYYWNFRSIIRLFISVQIISGFFLSFHYSPHSFFAFDSIIHIINNVNFRFFFRYIHINRASRFILFIYIHLFRRLYYKRYSNNIAWFVRVLLLILSIITAFLRYVLPWRQISFWRATVITNLVSVLPFRNSIVIWLWRRFSVDLPTLERFFSIHFITPFLIAIFSITHLVFIHGYRSRNPLRFFSDSFKLDFWPFFVIKDFLRFFIIFFGFFFCCFFFPEVFSDPDNYIKANPLVTPTHIKPEWYFLFAYAILRAIPNKTLRVIVLAFSLLVFFLLPFYKSKLKISFLYQLVFWLWVINFLLLIWLRRCLVKQVFINISILSRIIYFFLLCILPVL